MDACGTCDGRGYVLRFPGDQHGDVCPDCSDPMLSGGEPPRRRWYNGAKTKWYAGEKVTRQHHNGSGTAVHYSPGYERARRRKRYYA